jgi:hypothetical protein
VWALRLHRSHQGVTHQVRRHPGPHRMPDHLTRIQLFDPRQIQPHFCRRDIGDVGHPRLIRARRGERLSQEVVRHRQSMRRIRGGGEPAYRCTTQAQFLPQPLDAADPRWKAVVPQFRLETLRAVRVPPKSPLLGERFPERASRAADAATQSRRFETPPAPGTTASAESGDAAFASARTGPLRLRNVRGGLF